MIWYYKMINSTSPLNLKQKNLTTLSLFPKLIYIFLKGCYFLPTFLRQICTKMLFSSLCVFRKIATVFSRVMKNNFKCIHTDNYKMRLVPQATYKKQFCYTIVCKFAKDTFRMNMFPLLGGSSHCNVDNYKFM